MTRTASGPPVGGDLEHAEELTLGRALQGRREASGCARALRPATGSRVRLTAFAAPHRSCPRLAGLSR
ncbi:MAG: hypothetical protein WAV54_16195 [Acidimicrobiales bacterium]